MKKFNTVQYLEKRSIKLIDFITKHLHDMVQYFTVSCWNILFLSFPAQRQKFRDLCENRYSYSIPTMIHVRARLLSRFMCPKLKSNGRGYWKVLINDDMALGGLRPIAIPLLTMDILNQSLVYLTSYAQKQSGKVVGNPTFNFK